MESEKRAGDENALVTGPLSMSAATPAARKSRGKRILLEMSQAALGVLTL